MTDHATATIARDANDLESALRAAQDAAGWLARTGPSERAALLKRIADGIDARADDFVETAHHETHLSEVRLRGELVRTVFQLRLFAAEVASGGHLDATIDHADPGWPMGPRPDLRRTRVPLGPVLVFAASNFPFAFGVAGGDTASAWADGCPVIAKAHSYQPGVADLFAAAVGTALEAAAAPAGVFAVVHGRELGTAALQDPRIRAAGFTGSLEAGRALFDLATGRPEPIPFYGELSSINPVFVTPAADAARSERIASEFAASYTLGAGQFCTKPGVLFVPRDSVLPERIVTALADVPAARLLHPALAASYAGNLQAVGAAPGVRVLSGSPQRDGDQPSPTLLEVDARELSAQPAAYLVECFGPAAVVVRYDDVDRLPELAALFDGQLTAGIQGEPEDATDSAVRALVAALEARAGRILWNGWPTGVTVSWAQQHGGPYPATTAPATTSVGVAAIGRFSRPVAYQDVPEALLPEELRETAPTGVRRRVDGAPVVIGPV